MRHALDEARRAGVEFDDAWPTALGVLNGRGRDSRHWRKTFEETRPAWEAAYTRTAMAPAWVDVLEDAFDQIAA